MVCEDSVLLPCKVGSPPLAGSHNGQQLPLPSVVVPLSAVELPAVVLNRLHAPALVLLQLCTNGKLAGICAHLKGEAEVRDQQDGCCGQPVLQLLKGLCMWRAPLPGSILAQQLCKGSCKVGKTRDKPLVVVCHAQKHPELLHISGGRPGGDSLDFGWVWRDPSSSHHVPQVLYTVQAKGALLKLGKQPMLPQLPQDPLQVLGMFLIRPGEDEYVIQVHSHKIIQVVAQNLVHKPLESCRSISEPKRHHCILIQPPPAHKGCPMLMPRFNRHLMVALLQVYLGEDLAASQPIQDVINPGDGVPIHHSIGVKPPVVYTHPHSAILLLGKQDGVCIL